MTFSYFEGIHKLKKRYEEELILFYEKYKKN